MSSLFERKVAVWVQSGADKWGLTERALGGDDAYVDPGDASSAALEPEGIGAPEGIIVPPTWPSNPTY